MDKVKAYNTFCPMCGEPIANSISYVDMKLKDVYGRRFTAPLARVCNSCTAYNYKDTNGKWKSGYFDEITGEAFYIYDDDDIPDYIETSEVLYEKIMREKNNKMTSNKEKYKRIDTSTNKVIPGFNQQNNSKTKKKSKKDAYYYKSSLKGILLK